LFPPESRRPPDARSQDPHAVPRDRRARHHDGRVWSRALYDIHNALGRTTAHTIILRAQSSFATNTSFEAAALATVAAALAAAGQGAAVKVRKAFEDRGIL
jgi:Zn-dependent metalloprotease